MIGKNKNRRFIALILLLPMIWGISCASAKNMKGMHLDDITLPTGFAINIYANNEDTKFIFLLGYEFKN